MNAPVNEGKHGAEAPKAPPRGVNFVTGASGHLGANLVRALLARGEEVRVLYRPGSDNRAVEGLPIERVPGDLTDAKGLAEAMEGCARVYHCAAFVSIRNRDRRRLFDVNVLGTRHVLEAARRVGAAKVVHCSSFGAMGRNPAGASNERWVIDPLEVEMDYERAKAFAELEVLRAAVRGQNVTIVNPSGIIGPWDYKPSMVGKTMLDFLAGKLRLYITGGFDFVPVYDVVQGHILAMERGRAGERYLLSGETATLEEIIGWWSGWTGRGMPVQIPGRPIELVAGLKDWVESRWFPNRIPRFNRSSIRLLRSGKRGDNTKARTELGLEPTAIRDAFRAQMQWFFDHGFAAAPRDWVEYRHPNEPAPPTQVAARAAAG